MLKEKEVIEGCIRGERECQKIIYEEFYSLAHNICMRWASSTDEGKDHIQDCFIKMFGSIDKFTGGNYAEFGGWFKSLIRNFTIDFNRKRTIKTVNTEDFYNLDYSEDEVYEESEYNITDIVEAVQRLKPKYRTVFNMYVMDGFTHKEIGEFLECTSSSSKKNLDKAKIKLRYYLKDDKIKKQQKIIAS